MNTLKGLNTGTLLHEGNFLALALKIKTRDDKTELFYLQLDTLKDLMMIVQNRLVLLEQKVRIHPELIKDQVASANEDLRNNIIQVDISELQNPEPACRVMTLSASVEEHQFKILFVRQDESVHQIKVSDSQTEFFAVAIAQVLKNSGIDNLAQQLSLGLNYVPVYDALFQPNGSIDYSLIECESWKLDLFNQYMLIVYSIGNDIEKEHRFGAVIKTHAEANELELEHIARHFALMSKRITPSYSLICEIKARPLAFHKEMIPSPAEALQPLAEFHKSLCSS